MSSVLGFGWRPITKGFSSGLDFLGLWDDLETLLGREVDLVTERALKPHVRARVLREAVAL